MSVEAEHAQIATCVPAAHGSTPCGRARRSGRLRPGSSTTIEHPELGPRTVDVDVLQEPETDQNVLVYSAAPGTPEASALELLRVTGLERFAYRQ